MDEIIVSKFGGSSITEPEDIQRIRDIVEDDPRRKVIVVSAPGKRDASDVKVTDMLIQFARSRDPDLVRRILGRYDLLNPQKSNHNLDAILERRLKSDLVGPAFEDALKSFGEEASARLIADKLGYRYADPRDFLRVTENYGNARILPESKKMVGREMFEPRVGGKNFPVVVPGFFGYTSNCNIATFSRGGSDLTGAFLASALEAVLYENFTDREGVFNANPDLVEASSKIDELTFDEMRDLSYSGFSVLHHEAIRPVQQARIPIHIRNTFSYPSTGTHVVVDRISDPRRPIVGIAYREGFCAFNISNSGLDDKVGALADILGIFKQQGISVEHVPTGIDDLSVIVSQEPLQGHYKIGYLINQITPVIRVDLEEGAEQGRIEVQDNLGCLVVAGKGLRGNRGIAADIQQELASNGINIRFMSQGAQERCIIYGLDSKDGTKAVNTLYSRYLK